MHLNNNSGVATNIFLQYLKSGVASISW